MVQFETPPLDEKILVKGHLKAGKIMFNEDANEILMGHITPNPEHINLTCVGELSGNHVVLHKENIKCLIKSRYEVKRSDFIEE